MEKTDKNLELLIALSIMLHPHLGADNYTAKLITALYTDKSKLSNRDYFDLGKYYDRMVVVIQTEITDQNIKWEYLKAVMAMKQKCYGPYCLSGVSLT